MLVRASAPKEASGKVFGFVYSGLDVGAAGVPIVFGWLLDHGHAPWVFVVMSIGYGLAIGAVALTGSRRPPAAVAVPVLRK
jgi:MFS family permease